MPTLLVLGHSETGDRKTKKILVAESFEEVMNKVAPITPPASSLEQRQAMTYTQTDGRPIYLFTPIIRVVADVLSIEDDEDD